MEIKMVALTGTEKRYGRMLLKVGSLEVGGQTMDYDTYTPGLGYRVTKTGDVSTSVDALFTVTGKNIVTLMVGEVTSVIATTTSLQIISSVGTRVWCASTDIVTELVGTLYVLTGDPDDTLSGQTANVVGTATVKTGVNTGVMVNDNRIDQSINGAGTGLIEWTLYYIPLEDDAEITAAA
jgi:hypothetical protein